MVIKMKKILNPVLKQFKTAEKLSYYILYVGLIISMLLFTASGIASILIDGRHFTNFYIEFLSGALIETGLTMLTVTFIGFFITDYILKKELSNNEK